MTISEPTSSGPDTIPTESIRKHPLAKCENCTLKGSENVFVPSVIVPDSTIVIVGEAPGTQEAKKGIPFSGPSGNLLNVVLDHSRIERDQLSLTNTCLCRPPDNRTPSKVEVAACWPRLKAELEGINPRKIVTLGNTATQAILGTREGITSVRVGPPKRSPYFPEADVIPTFHPAACLRSSDYFPDLVTDIGKVNPVVEVRFEPPVYKVFDDSHSAVQALEELHRRSDVRDLVVDIECGFEKDTEFDHPDHYQMLCVGLGYAPGKVAVIGEEALKSPRVEKAMGKLLTSDKNIVAHNGKFDLAGLSRYGRGVLGDDTMLASYLCDERRGTNGLKYLAVELLGAPQYDDEIREYVPKGKSFSSIPRDILYRYNAYDISCTWLLMERYRLEMAGTSLLRPYQLLLDASNALIDSEMEGIKLDEEYLNHLMSHYDEGLKGLELEMKEWVANPRSPKQVKEALDAQGYSVASTNEDTLTELLGRIKPDSDTARFIRKLLQHRTEAKLFGTYVKGIHNRNHRGRIHPTFLLHGTTTGRLACRNPNLQNVPRGNDIRRMYIPEEGNLFVQADYSTIELRVLATLARDEYLRGIFKEGRDIHNEFSLILFGEGFNKEQRVRTKAFVYGLAYGREAPSIAMEFGIPIREAQRSMNTFLDAIPDVVEYKKSIKKQALQDQEDLISPFGRHRRYWLVTKDNMHNIEKEAYAFMPQSTASDICLSALVRLKRDHGLSVRLPVHDSILVECAASDAQDVARLMEKVMMETAAEEFSDYVPFPVDVHIGKNWGEV